MTSCDHLTGCLPVANMLRGQPEVIVAGKGVITLRHYVVTVP